MAWLGFVAGLALLAITWSSVVKWVLLPGYAPSRISAVVATAVLAFFRVIAARISDPRRRERVLAAGPPVYLLSLLVTWEVCLYFGYALILLPFTSSSPTAALRLSGSSLFTLGFAAPAGAVGYGLVFVAALSGIGVIALLIGYMPTLYSAYNRRETLVTMLEALSGSPPWGPRLLVRQQIFGFTGYLPRLYERWAEWAADITESHATYRTLIYFRSRNGEMAWPVALLAVLDAAALHLALCPDSAPAEARLLLRLGFTATRSIAKTLGVPVNEDPHPDDPVTLTRAEFDEALERMVAVGWVFERQPDEAWKHFRGWRVNYETAVHNIAAHLDLQPAPWSGPRSHLGVFAPLPGRPARRTPASRDSSQGPQ